MAAEQQRQIANCIMENGDLELRAEGEEGTVASSWTNGPVLTLAGWRYLCLLRQT